MILLHMVLIGFQLQVYSMPSHLKKFTIYMYIYSKKQKVAAANHNYTDIQQRNFCVLLPIFSIVFETYATMPL